MSDDFLESINCINEFLVECTRTGEMPKLCDSIKTLLGEFNDLHRLFKQRDNAFERLGDIQYMTEEALRAADKWILSHAEFMSADHACDKCVPGGEIVINGFVCVYHQAVARANEKKP